MTEPDVRRPDTHGPPAFVAAPFARKTWTATLDSLLSLPIGVASFSYTVVLVAFGIGTAITPLGLPVLAAAVAGARGWGRMERVRAATLLDVRIPSPPPMSRPGRGFFGWLTAALTDVAGWRGLLYLFLLLPLGIVSVVLTVTCWVVAFGHLSYPLWHTSLPDGISMWHPYDPFDTLGESFIVAGVGLVLVFLAPWVGRGCGAVRRGMARGLLGRIGEER